MSNTNMEEDFLKRARKYLGHAEESFKQYKGGYPLCISSAQTSIELSLKAALRLVKVEHPYAHDVGGELAANRDKFPGWFKEKIPHFALVSKIVGIWRKYAMYGYEITDTPPTKLFVENEAKMSIENAREILHSCERLLHEIKQKT